MTAGSSSSDSTTPRERPPSSSSSSVPRPSGLVLSPFRALRYDTTTAGDLRALTSPPYDVIDEDGVAALEAASEHNVVRLILPRDPLGGPEDRYGRAAQTLQQWRDQGVLRPDEAPALYVYEQAAPGGHVQRGLVGALGLTPAEDGIVLPHENTIARAVGDRLALYEAVGADLEPIFLVHDGGGAAAEAVAGAGTPEGPPLLVDAELADGLRHRVWALTDPDVLRAVAEDLHPRRALIADGHHRYATYLQRQAAHHAAGSGPGPWDFGLCFLVDATAFGPQVHPIHRVVPGTSPGELAERAAVGMAVRRLDGGLEAGFDAALAALADAGRTGPAFLLASGDTEELHLLSEPDPSQVAASVPAGRSPAWAALDVSVLHAFVVTALWGLPDDVDHVGYEHDVADALATAAKTSGTAVLLNPTPVEAVAAVAAAGERMPRKSTLFTPKPATGLLLRDHRDAGPA
jgi:uncharacterized protein (DUF1015 family)